MEIVKTELPGVVMLTPRRFGDARGFFSEVYNRDAYAGLGIDVDGEGVPVAIRVHDGSTPGGRLTALVNPNTVTGALPAAVVVPEISLSLTGSVPENVHHTLGYKPFVSLLDGTGQAVSADEYTIVHHDDDNFSITSTADGTFSLLLR